MLRRRLLSSLVSSSSSTATAAPPAIAAFASTAALVVTSTRSCGGVKGVGAGATATGGGGSGGPSPYQKQMQQHLAMGPVPAYRKPPPTPAGTHLPVHVGGGTGPDDPFVRTKPNQPTRLPESAVLSSQRALVLTQEERRDPQLLARRRLPIGEWLRKSFTQQDEQHDHHHENSSSSSAGADLVSPLELYVKSLMLPLRCGRLGPAQQAAIRHFEKDIIDQASVENSVDANLERTRWRAEVVRKFKTSTTSASGETDDALHLFDPDAFKNRLEKKMKPLVMNFLSSSTSSSTTFDSELEEVFQILADDATAIRNHKLRELCAAASPLQGAAGNLIWSRFFEMVEHHKEALLTPHDQRVAMWMSSRENSMPIVSPAVCLLFMSIALPTKSSSSAAAAAGGGAASSDEFSSTATTSASSSSSSSEVRHQAFVNSQITLDSLATSDTLWGARGIVARHLSRDELFNFCAVASDSFLGPMDARVAAQLRQSGFSDLAYMAEHISVTAAQNPLRESLIGELLPAFRDVEAVKTVVSNVLKSGDETAAVRASVRSFVSSLLKAHLSPKTLREFNMNYNNSSSASSSGRGPAPVQEAIALFKALTPDWETIHEGIARELLAHRAFTKLFFQTLYNQNLGKSSAKASASVVGHGAGGAGGVGARQHVALGQTSFQRDETKKTIERLISYDAAVVTSAEKGARAIKTRLLSLPDEEIGPRVARMLLRCAHQNNNLQQQQQKDQNQHNRNNNTVLAVESFNLLSLLRQRILAASREPATPAWLYKAAVNKVAQETPNWLQVGVLTKRDLSIVDPTSLTNSSSSSSSNSSTSLAAAAPGGYDLLLRVYLRLSYLPHAANALLKSRHRRRIGPIAKQRHQFNIEAEVGFAEEYNIQDYKQWDWQGWYQRLMDVYHRNVSVRVRLDDLRRLDNNGRPFIDLQTERRLRVLAGERVGAGMAKLDSDRFEDQHDNLEYGTGKLQQLLSEAKKAQLGREYWPSVEVKVREPSGQSKMHYSLLDWDRVETQSADMYAKYREAKGKTIFVPPTETWLRVSGHGGGRLARAGGSMVDEEGYTVDQLFSTMDGGADDGATAGGGSGGKK